MLWKNLNFSFKIIFKSLNNDLHMAWRSEISLWFLYNDSTNKQQFEFFNFKRFFLWSVKFILFSIIFIYTKLYIRSVMFIFMTHVHNKFLLLFMLLVDFNVTSSSRNFLIFYTKTYVEVWKCYYVRTSLFLHTFSWKNELSFGSFVVLFYFQKEMY